MERKNYETSIKKLLKKSAEENAELLAKDDIINLEKKITIIDENDIQLDKMQDTMQQKRKYNKKQKTVCR